MNKQFEDTKYYVKRAGETAKKGISEELEPIQERVDRSTHRRLVDLGVGLRFVQDLAVEPEGFQDVLAVAPGHVNPGERESGLFLLSLVWIRGKKRHGQGVRLRWIAGAHKANSAL